MRTVDRSRTGTIHDRHVRGFITRTGEAVVNAA